MKAQILKDVVTEITRKIIWIGSSYDGTTLVKSESDSDMDQHPKIAYCYVDLAKIYEEKGECEKAIRYYLKAYKICVVIFGINNFHTQDVYRNMYLLWSRINVRWGFSQWLKEKMKE